MGRIPATVIPKELGIGVDRKVVTSDYHPLQRNGGRGFDCDLGEHSFHRLGCEFQPGSADELEKALTPVRPKRRGYRTSLWLDFASPEGRA